MADPILQASGPATLVQSAGTTAAQTGTSGLSDPQFLQGIAEAYEQAAKGATTFTPKGEPSSAPDGDAEPDDILTPPKPEAPKPEPKPTPETKPEPPKATPPAEPKKTKAEQWKELHRLRDEAERKAQDLQKRYEELEQRSKAIDPEEVKRIRAERDDYEQRLKAFAVEHDPAFEQQMNTRLGRIKSEAEVALGENSKRFLSLLELPEGEFKRQQISNAMADMDEFTKMSAFQLANKHRELSIERQEYVKNARENYQKILDAQARQAEAMKTRVVSEFENTVKQWQDPKNGLPVLQMKDGDDQWNSEVRETIASARDILTGQKPPEELIRASLWAASAPKILKSMGALHAQLQEVIKERDALKAAMPDPTRSGGGDMQAEPDEDFKGMSYGQILAAKAERAGGFMR